MVHETKDTKLISGAAPHFEAQPLLKEVFASADGQYFHTVSASNYHCKAHNVKVYRITRAQMPTKEPPAPPKPAEPAPPKPAEPAIPEIDKTPKTVPPPKNKGGRPVGSTKAKSATTKKKP